MSRPDVTDKDPFANTEDAPRDNVSGFGFFFRTILRYWFRVLIFGLGAGAITYIL